MPTLFRILTVLAITAGVVYGVMYLLANGFTPTPREITVSVPADKLNQPH